MAARHTSRERALQMLFQLEASGDAPERVQEVYWGGLAAELGSKETSGDAYADRLFLGALRHGSSIDERIQAHAKNWKLDRMSAVDRNILRLAVFEIEHEGQPAAVVITEAIELGRRFSGDESAKFLNGVLDAIRKTIGGVTEPDSPTPEPAVPPQS